MQLTGYSVTQPTPMPPALLAQMGVLAQDTVDPPAEAPTEAPAEGEQTLEDGSPAAGGGGGTPPPAWYQILQSPLIPLILLIVVFYVFIIGGNRKKEKQRQEMINSLSRGDRVTTIGGIIGNVVDATGDEVTVKIDESSNTKMKFTRSAIASVTKAGAEKK